MQGVPCICLGKCVQAKEVMHKTEVTLKQIERDRFLLSTTLLHGSQHRSVNVCKSFCCKKLITVEKITDLGEERDCNQTIMTIIQCCVVAMFAVLR